MSIFNLYLDAVDTKAFQNVGTDYGSREAPILPLLAPWMIVGPLLYMLRDHQAASEYLFTGALVVSVAAYGATMWFYIRAKQRYRKEMNLPDWREKMRQKVEDDMAKLD